MNLTMILPYSVYWTGIILIPNIGESVNRPIEDRHKLDKGAATKLEEAQFSLVSFASIDLSLTQAMSMREAMGKDVEKDMKKPLGGKSSCTSCR